ncbi:phage terminase large subunit [Flavobacterium agricola]|uniref:Phage terminase large subunit n=1 Tax=Flavobacterium agricola TaxID=2870839 RepID=A0ABY6M0J0_9FLAO|nr:phage terminase large subunit [Flavobacterium agricola]UYW01787.1 phage terminase large subunit [Flavobacterium agricola]
MALTEHELAELEMLLIQQRADVLRGSLFEFMKEFWNVLYSNDYEHNWHMEYICDEYQLVVDKYVLGFETPRLPLDKWYKGFGRNIKKNLVCSISPGTGKSTVISRASTGWLWSNDAGKTELNNTISDSNSNGFSKDSKDVVESAKYQMYFPEVKIRKDVSAKTFFETNKKGIRYSSTTMSKDKTGKHADVLKDDDQMDYNTAQSPVEAKRCIEGFKAMQSRKKDKRKTPYILFMQRLSMNDTVKHALKVFGDDVTYICLPAENKHNNVIPSELNKYYIDGLLDPNRLSLEVLDKEKKGLNDDTKPMSEMAYEIQYNQLEVSAEGLMYPKLNFVPTLPDERGEAIRMSFTDVADTGADYLCTWFIEINQGKIYVFDCIYTQAGSNVTIPLLKNKIEIHGSIINKVEVNNQGSVFVSILRSQGVNVSGYSNTGNKEARIESYAQFIDFFYFVQDNSDPNFNAAIKHLQTFPRIGKAEDGHDDAEDALTESFRYLYTNYRHLLQKFE